MENFGGESFSFKSLSKDDIPDIVKNLPSNKASISSDIPVSIINNFATCYCEKLASIFNDFLKENKFPNKLLKLSQFLKSSTTPLNTTIRYTYSTKLY